MIRPAISIVLLLAIFAICYVPAAAQSQVSDQAVGHDAWASWSPDNRRILYTKFVPLDNRGKLFRVSEQDRTPRPVMENDNFSYGQASWSSDGKRIVFGSNRSGSFQIWTATDAGTDLKQISSEGQQNFQPCWSPDGNKIAYASYPEQQIRIISAAGGKAEPFAQGFSPAWSPDGKYIAYLSTSFDERQSVTGIWVKSVSGGSPRRLSSTSFRWSQTGWPPSVDWSPDGTRLLTSRPVEGRWEIAIVDVIKNKIVNTRPMSGSALNPRWSSDGKTVLFSFTDTGHPAGVRILSDAGSVDAVTKAASYTMAELASDVERSSPGNDA